MNVLKLLDDDYNSNAYIYVHFYIINIIIANYSILYYLIFHEFLYYVILLIMNLRLFYKSSKTIFSFKEIKRERGTLLFSQSSKLHLASHTFYLFPSLSPSLLSICIAKLNGEFDWVTLSHLPLTTSTASRRRPVHGDALPPSGFNSLNPRSQFNCVS